MVARATSKERKKTRAWQLENPLSNTQTMTLHDMSSPIAKEKLNVYGKWKRLRGEFWLTLLSLYAPTDPSIVIVIGSKTSGMNNWNINEDSTEEWKVDYCGNCLLEGCIIETQNRLTIHRAPSRYGARITVESFSTIILFHSTLRTLKRFEKRYFSPSRMIDQSGSFDECWWTH